MQAQQVRQVPGIADWSSWREVGANEVRVSTIGVGFNDLFVLCAFSLILYFLFIGQFVLILAALFLLALFYTPSKEKRPDRREASL